MTVLELNAAVASRLDAQQLRIVEAALRCVARWGIAKTTLDDVARESGLSRATVYRAVPGGKDGLVELVVDAELAQFFAAVTGAAENAETLEDALVAAMTEATRRLRSHPGLQFVLAHEPEHVLPRIAFGHLDDVLRHVAGVATPFLVRWLPERDAELTAEWITRIVLSYATTSSASFELTDPESTRRLVRTFVLPGLAVHA
ncbi:MAG TPA: helix-turn-helix domain-containing protein [Acidimicrobiales bacterium]|nr:helix-turn-helix domain-containing protein [Acidimicrobiales bacterium]